MKYEQRCIPHSICSFRFDSPSLIKCNHENNHEKQVILRRTINYREATFMFTSSSSSSTHSLIRLQRSNERTKVIFLTVSIISTNFYWFNAIWCLISLHHRFNLHVHHSTPSPIRVPLRSFCCFAASFSNFMEPRKSFLTLFVCMFKFRA